MSEISLKEWVNERLTSARDHVDTVDRLRKEALELAFIEANTALELAFSQANKALDVALGELSKHLITLNGHAEALRKQQETFVPITEYQNTIKELRNLINDNRLRLDKIDLYIANQQGRSAASGAVAGVLAGGVVAVVVSLILRAIP